MSNTVPRLVTVAIPQAWASLGIATAGDGDILRKGLCHGKDFRCARVKPSLIEVKNFWSGVAHLLVLQGLYAGPYCG